MAESRVASRYVKSLLGLAEEQQALDLVHSDMLLFTRVCNENRAFALMLRSPVIRHDKKRDVLQKIFGGKVHTLTMAFFDIITRKNREPLLPSIAREFHNAYNEYKGIGTAQLVTPFPVDAALRREFEGMVQQISKKKQIELVEKVDADMIGGFVLTVGDRQVDASIRNKLKALKIKFSQNPYVKGF
ncbi:ATP synthase F1 subunit delta [Oscillatoria amoena NRMC-F 0135]|jgi:F-type H+-transporting ATPase subunit delta|nr:ATP synthase F1 subunit delta [Oscillatoria amoena NRMC-F 0135]